MARGGQDDQRATRLFHHSLTLVYRLLFLLFAEARDLVPTWHHVYRDAYTIEALAAPTRVRFTPARTVDRRCRRSPARARRLPRRRPDRHAVQWPPVLAASHAARRTGADFRCGRWSRGAGAGDDAVREGRRRDLIRRSRRRAARHGLRTRPRVPDRRAGTGTHRLLTRTSSERKTIPAASTRRASMTEFLVRRTLHPLVAGQIVRRDSRARVVDPAMGSGAFLVAPVAISPPPSNARLMTEGRLARR